MRADLPTRDFAGRSLERDFLPSHEAALRLHTAGGAAPLPRRCGCFAEGATERVDGGAACLEAPRSEKDKGGGGGMVCWPRHTLLWLLTGACGLALLGYCIYFDRSRRSAPDFKRRLREKRRKESEKAREYEAELRKLKSSAKVQDFFLQEIQLGELCLARGEQKKSIEHLINAISVCTHPNQLLQVLEQTLPPQVFEMLVHSIPYSVQRLESVLNEQDA